MRLRHCITVLINPIWSYWGHKHQPKLVPFRRHAWLVSLICAGSWTSVFCRAFKTKPLVCYLINLKVSHSSWLVAGLYAEEIHCFAVVSSSCTVYSALGKTTTSFIWIYDSNSPRCFHRYNKRVCVIWNKGYISIYLHCQQSVSLILTTPSDVQGMTLNCIHIFIVAGSFL